MKVFQHSMFIRSLFLFCFCVCMQQVSAQVQDSLAVDSTSVREPAPEQRPRAFVMASVRAESVLYRMPQYKAMQDNMKALREQYEAEARKSEEDFQRKFEEFMQGKAEFPKTILEKRQNELQNMLESNARFRIKVQELLAEAEKSLMEDVRAELNEAIALVAQGKGVGLVFDLDNGSVPYLAPGMAVDITADVVRYLGIEE
ncbi:MAG: OmpH family outer membrane protein [Bacteroidaceae bacterium]|nr:OmpH family outer membrane protein [Bacteroidaceae bacterium]